MSDQNKEQFRPDENLDEELQRELAEALGSMNVGSLMDTDEPVAAPAAPGVKRGRVVSIQKNDIFVDMGGKSQGILPAIQFEDEPLPREGDLIEVTIEGYDNAEGCLILSRKGAVMAASWQNMQEGQIVEGRVTGHNKGGLELDVDGIRAFMPISQIELFRVEDNLAPYDNQRLKCEIVDVRRDERSIVVSRKAVLQEEAAEAKARTFQSLSEGDIVAGTVRTIMPYGAFVDIGGVDGLLHIGDMSYTRVADPKEIVKEGQKLQVKVLKIDRDTRKIGLGLKQVMPDPWSDVDMKYPPGTMVAGRITRLEQFGAFAEIEPGIEGLIPISEITYERRIAHPREAVKEGDVVNLVVLSNDVARRRISLSLKQAGVDPWQGASVRWPVDSVAEGVVKRTTEFGAFVELTPGVEGLVHISELTDEHVRKVESVVQIGQVVKARVLEVDEERRRVSLSIRQLKEMPDYMGEEPPAAQVAAPTTPKKRKKPLKGGLEW
jgi:small subunit ribosomal protein S1